MSKQLSECLKQKYLPLLIAIYGGFICFYCGISLKLVSWIYEHLDDNRGHNEIENIALSCVSCNNRKPHNREMQMKALKQLEQNKKMNFVEEREIVNESHKEVSAEIEINMSNYEITEQHISEKIKIDGAIEFADALNSSVYLCKSKTDHGSQQSVRNYLASLTSAVGPFQVVKDAAKRKIITKRSGN